MYEYSLTCAISMNHVLRSTACYRCKTKGYSVTSPESSQSTRRIFWRNSHPSQEVPIRQSKFTETQIISMLKEADAGRSVNKIWRSYGISSATYYKWKAKYGGLEASEITRLKKLEHENGRLKCIYADLSLENAALKDVSAKKLYGLLNGGRWWPTWSVRTASPFSGPVQRWDSAGQRTTSVLIDSGWMGIRGIPSGSGGYTVGSV